MKLKLVLLQRQGDALWLPLQFTKILHIFFWVNKVNYIVLRDVESNGLQQNDAFIMLSFLEDRR